MCINTSCQFIVKLIKKLQIIFVCQFPTYVKKFFIWRNGQNFANCIWSISETNCEQIIKIGSELEVILNMPMLLFYGPLCIA